ncbi:MAG: ABC transporter substrate-binding protein [Candidatus Portnoybacteria bacterium]|nr:ABC transporter substrate-binding protein [Candidatus Portnoybacteria bacterium]MDD4982881.1 ABC transporter substrate-binding protein [Candidatus Portnoybacteria bacterium]
MNRRLAIIIISFIVLSGLGIAGWFYYNANIVNRDTTLAAFPNKRNSIIYRTYLGNYFDGEDVKVKLYSKDLKSGEFKIFDNNFTNFGETSGRDIIQKIANKEFDGGVVDGGAFLFAVNRNLPIAVVTGLGYNQALNRNFILRKDIKIGSPGEMKGMTFLSQSGSQEEVMYLKEFFKSAGMDPAVDVKIIDQVNSAKSLELLKEKKVDGGIYKSRDIETILKEDTGYVYRQMDWLDPRLNFSVLVFNQDFIKNHTDKVEKIIRAYGKRLKYEKDRPDFQKNLSETGVEFVIGDWKEIGALPEYDYPPVVNVDRLYQLQDLEIKYGVINKKARIEDYINNSFAESIR